MTARIANRNGEPAWIAHDGSAVCPVPAGHKIDIRSRRSEWSDLVAPGGLGWQSVQAYRDWTAFAQEQETMKTDDVPEWAIRELCDRAMIPWETYLRWCLGNSYAARAIEFGARLIAAHEPAPVDPLEAEIRCAFDDLHWKYEDRDVNEIVFRIRRLAAKGEWL